MQDGMFNADEAQEEVQPSERGALDCPLTLGPLGRVQCSQRFRWYPFWFLATFLMDTAEELEENFQAFVGTAAVQQEVHSLCCHALDVLGSGCIATYR